MPWVYTSGNLSWEKTMSKQVFPHAPSPTITSFFRVAEAMLMRQREGGSELVYTRDFDECEGNV